MVEPSEINERNTLSGNLVSKKCQASIKGRESNRCRTAEEISKRSEEPESADAQRRTDLILVESELRFTAAEKDLNLPAASI